MRVKNRYIRTFIMWFAICLVNLNGFALILGMYVYVEKGFLDTEMIFRMFILSVVSPFFVVFIEVLFDFIPFICRRLFK